MDPWLVVIVVTWPVILWWAVDSLLARLSPKYAAKRRLRAEAKATRQRQARKKREERNHARMVKWAQKHPDDPDAKEFLALVVPSGTEDGATDYLAEIRRSQQADDEDKRRAAERKAARELRERQTLEWAIGDPTTPEARRHLDEQLEAATDRLEAAVRSIGHCQTMMDYMKGDLDPEFIAQSTRLAEAEATKATEVELIRRIQEALDVKLPEPSEQ